MDQLDHAPLFTALTRPQMFAGAPDTAMVMRRSPYPAAVPLHDSDQASDGRRPRGFGLSHKGYPPSKASHPDSLSLQMRLDAVRAGKVAGADSDEMRSASREQIADLSRPGSIAAG